MGIVCDKEMFLRTDMKNLWQQVQERGKVEEPKKTHILHFYIMNILLVSVCMYIMCVPVAYRGQKRASDLLELELPDGCELPHGC